MSDVQTRHTHHEPNNMPAGVPATMRWKVVDIVVASVLAVAIGIVFWAWSNSWETISAPFQALYPPTKGLLTGVWVLGGVLGGLIIRKPGAALYVEVLAAIVSAVPGNYFGLMVIVSGLIQGFGAEIIFASLRYRRYTFIATLLAGLGAGLSLAIGENILYNAAWTFEHKALYTVFAGISGMVLAGLVSWFALKAIARTGALGAFASGRSAREV